MTRVNKLQMCLRVVKRIGNINKKNTLHTHKRILKYNTYKLHEDEHVSLRKKYKGKWKFDVKTTITTLHDLMANKELSINKIEITTQHRKITDIYSGQFPEIFNYKSLYDDMKIQLEYVLGSSEEVEAIDNTVRYKILYNITSNTNEHELKLDTYRQKYGTDIDEFIRLSSIVHTLHYAEVIMQRQIRLYNELIASHVNAKVASSYLPLSSYANIELTIKTDTLMKAIYKDRIYDGSMKIYEAMEWIIAPYIQDTIDKY